MSERLYQVLMYCGNTITEFETTTPQTTLSTFEERGLIKFKQPNGKVVIHDTSKYFSIEVMEIK